MTRLPHNADGLDRSRMESSVKRVKSRLGSGPIDAAAILGSGWGDISSTVDVLDTIPYSEIPCLGKTGVKGHKGMLMLGRTASGTVLVFQGRRHWYEGIGWTPIAFPVFLARELGARAILLTNAAGAIRPRLRPGDLMVVSDHINLIGSNPLIGTHDPFWGERFTDQSQVYPESLQDILASAVHRHGLIPQRGVYLAASGPVYETPAEIRAFRTLGADAVGMSTVPEAILANAAGMKTAALSCITNFAAGIGTTALHHDEVLAVSQARQPILKMIVGDVLQALCAHSGAAA